MIFINYVIGIDGGGTKTAIVAINAESRKVIASMRSVQINGNYTDINRAASKLVEDIKSLVPGERLIAVGLGDPSSDDLLEADSSITLKNAIKKKLDAPLFIRSDAYMALYGLTSGKPGALMISGTGSMGIAEDKKNQLYVVGGWGRLTEDLGSGYYIAINGIKAALGYYDGILPPTMLLDYIKSYFECSNVRRLINVFYATPYSPPDIAGFSLCVSECAEKGDHTALCVLNHAAEYLAAYSRELVKKSHSDILGIYGSVLVKNAFVRDKFEKIVTTDFPGIVIREPKNAPEIAAAEYALTQLMKTKGAAI